MRVLGELPGLAGDDRGRTQVVGVEVPMLPVRRQSRLFGQQPGTAEEDVLELVAGAAADVGEILVGVEGGAGGVLALARAGMVIDELGRARALLLAGRAGRRRALVDAGEAVLLVEGVVQDVGGSALLGADVVAVGVVGDVEGADGGRPMRARRAGSRIGIGVVIGGSRLDRALEFVRLRLARDVVDRVVALAEAVGAGLARRRLVPPGRGRQPVEVVPRVALRRARGQATA